MTKNKGYVFEDEVARGFRAANMYFTKIPDTKMVGMVNVYLKKMGMHPIIFPKIPADYITHTPNGMTLYIECKATDSNRFPFERIKEHQLESGLVLSALHENINYWFLVYMKKHKRVFLLAPAIVFACLRNGWASLGIEDLELLGIEIQRLTAKYHPSKEGAFINFGEIFK